MRALRLSLAIWALMGLSGCRLPLQVSVDPHQTTTLPTTRVNQEIDLINYMRPGEIYVVSAHMDGRPVQINTPGGLGYTTVTIEHNAGNTVVLRPTTTGTLKVLLARVHTSTTSLSVGPTVTYTGSISP